MIKSSVHMFFVVVLFTFMVVFIIAGRLPFWDFVTFFGILGGCTAYIGLVALAGPDGDASVWFIPKEMMTTKEEQEENNKEEQEENNSV